MFLVPVYDAQSADTPLRLTLTDLTTIDANFARYPYEIPESAIVLLAYTTSKYQKGAHKSILPGQYSISHNLIWMAAIAA